jgi:hypothetical protein
MNCVIICKSDDFVSSKSNYQSEPHVYYHLTTHFSVPSHNISLLKNSQYKSADNSLYLVVTKRVLKAVIQITAITIFNIHISFLICCLQHIKLSMIYKVAPVAYDNIVACRPVAGQRLWDKQIYKSHYWVTSSQTNMFPWKWLNNSNEEHADMLWPGHVGSCS